MTNELDKFDMAYASIVQAIKEAIQRSQARTLHLMNGEVLSLYYGIGRYISDNSRNHFWGTGALAQISSQLQKEMPGLKGYSETSLKDREHEHRLQQTSQLTKNSCFVKFVSQWPTN